ncbi:MAG TPA: diguanylate cyclase, partial [Usitatibacter sp.]|nr:diguanylate cyclase [Usitatibacter sp.]
MELFAPDDRVAALEAALPALAGGERVRALTELAWHLRERDTRRARGLALEAGSLVGTHCGEAAEMPRLHARVELTLAECALLAFELEEARRHAGEALEAFERVSDADGASAAHWVLGRIARHRGRDGAPHEVPSLPRCTPPAAIEAHRRHADALALLHAGAPDRAIEALSGLAIDAPATGLHELAVEAQLLVASAFAMLGDADAAVSTAESVLDDARARGWRGFVVAASLALARFLLRAGQAPRAAAVLVEADLALQAAAPGAHDPALDCLLGRAQLADGRPAEAARTLRRAAARLNENGSVADMARVLALQALALGRAGDIAAGLDHAQQALRLARESRTRVAEMEALRALGELHATYPSVDRTYRSALAFLRHAGEIAEELGEPDEKRDLLQEMARLHEASGDLAAALAAERAARIETAAACERRAADLAAAGRARWTREQQRLTRRHARELDGVESEKARAIERAQEAMEQLRAVGHEIMGRPDPASVVAALESHLAALADVHFIALFAFDRPGGTLRRYAREAGRAIPVREIAAGDLESYAARSARERREMLVELESGPPRQGGELRDCATLWFGPVASGEHVAGVLTVQSRRQHAYGEPEKRLFRAFADYIAFALARADVQQELAAQRAQRIELEEQMHRLATIDRLTGLATRAHFFAVARERLERARRHGGPCGLIVCDVDGFKAVNDTRGHDAGDRVLAALGRALAAHIGTEDVAGRTGGEEFALL